MARGFGATLGIGATTDGVQTKYTTSLAQRTIALWINPRVANTGFNAISTKLFVASDTDVEDLYFGTAGTALNFDAFFTGGPGHWHVATAPATGAWSHLAYSYDNGATTNNPTFYFNGVAGSTVTDTAPVGTAKTNTSGFRIGGWQTDVGAACFDGMIAEYAIWSVLLTQGELTALAAGISPAMIRPASLVEYLPLIVNANSERNAPADLWGTQVQPHPRIYYPSRPSQLLEHTQASKTAFEGFQPNAFQASGYLQAEIRTAFQATAFQENAFQVFGGSSGAIGTASITLDALTVTAAGKVKSQGTLSKTLDALTLTGTGKVKSQGTASITLDALTMTGTAQLKIHGTLNVTLDALTLQGAGVPSIRTAFQPNAFQSNAFQIFGSQPQPETGERITGGGFKTVRERQLEQIYAEDEELLRIIRTFLEAA